MFFRKPVSQMAQTGNTTVQAVTDVAAALVAFDTGTGTPSAILEGGVTQNTTTSVVTVPDTGVYRARLTATVTPPAVTHTITLSIQKATTNIGGSAIQHKCVASTVFSETTEILVPLVAGDTLRPAIVSSDAGPQNYTTNEASFSVERVE